MNQSHSPQAPLASLNPGNATEANAIAQSAHAEVSNMAQKLKDAGDHVALERFCTHFNFEPMACVDMIGDAHRRTVELRMTEKHTLTTASLIGAPTDIGAGTRGAGMGPDALRVAGLGSAIAQFGLAVHDHGNLQGPPNPWCAAVDGFRHLPEVVAWNTLVHEAVYGALQARHVPVLMGGDHCLAIGSISAVARHCRSTGKKLRVLWLDAHADFNTATLTPSGNVHGMPVACLCGQGPDELTGIGGHTPALNPKQIRQIGIRSVDAGEKRLVREMGIEVFDMRYIDEMGMRHTMELALALVDANTHLHVSLDVDFLDPDIAPGVGTTVRGGPTYREAQLCMEMIADTGRMASLDIMELNPALDVRNQTAELTVDLVESLFGKSTLMRYRAGPSA